MISEAKSYTFLNTVRGALVVPEAELSGKDGEISNMSEAQQRGILSAHAHDLSFDEFSRWSAPSQTPARNFRLSWKTDTKLCAMAVQTKLFFVLQVCALIFIVNVTESVKRSKHGCIICGKKSQKTPFRGVHRQSNADLQACFGFLETTSGDICEACRKALQQYRSNGKTFHRVSVFSRLISLISRTLVMLK